MFFTNITFCKYHAFTSLVLMFFKNSRQTYALHLMNSLLNKFCYIISNVSNRTNLHRVQLITNSYPDRHDHSRSNVSCVYKGHDVFCPNNLGQSSRDSKKLSNTYINDQSGAIKSRFRESLKDAKNNQGHASK